MALGTSSGLEKVNIVLTKEQVRRLREIHQRETSAQLRISLSDVCRVVVEEGLAVVSLRPNIGTTSDDSTDLAS